MMTRLRRLRARWSAIPWGWRLAILGMLGLAVGTAGAAAQTSRMLSYLSDAPETCVNCHVMYPQYLTWQHDVHRGVATCNDCHVPHGNIVESYAFKAMDGLKHSWVFTTRTEPEVIRISQMAIPVVQQNCIRCHTDAVHPVGMIDGPAAQRLCWDCHRSVPHGTVRSLSSTPRQMTPQLPHPVRGGQPTIGGRPVRPTEPAP